MELKKEQRERYARQIAIDEVGQDGQKRLARARVLVVGGGGLGSPVAYYLVAAGIGCLGLVDDDVVSLSNLNRQILHNSHDLGRPKVESAREKLGKLNPEVELRIYQERFTPVNAGEIVRHFDCLVDATDNLETRQLLNQLSFEHKIPFFHGGVSHFYGQVMTVIPGQGPCWQCFVGGRSHGIRFWRHTGTGPGSRGGRLPAGFTSAEILPGDW
jgi:molybdopterin/thiamine biosynthesis adenylyltransferase